jgi:starch synthase
MKKPKVLYVSQEISPYLEGKPINIISRQLPQSIQENGMEIRTFMPRYGNINEIRHGLHEVIRLSGINQIIDDNDHPLIIKVASIQKARMQVYFIDNEDYFQRKATFFDEKGNLFEDNDERLVFFCRGVIETVRKLNWNPDIIHCHGWITALMPYYIKKACAEDPIFETTKVIYSLYNDKYNGALNKNLPHKALWEGAVESDLAILKDATYNNLSKFAITWSDGVINVESGTNPEVVKFIGKSGKPMLTHKEENYKQAYYDFYNEILEKEEVLVEE